MAYHDAYKWAKGGFLGVDAFFVLSGFLITTLLVLEWQRAQSIGLLAFWGRRVRRLLPALLLVIVFVAVYGVIAMPSYELDRLRFDGLAGLFYVANWRFIAAGQSYFDLFTSPSPFRHLWSLAIEEQFYLVWPLVVLGCLRLGRGRLRVLAIVCGAGIIASVYLMDALFRADDPSRAYYGTDSRAHTLLVGCLLALLLLVWQPKTPRARISIQVLGVVGAVGIIWAWFQVHDVEPGYYGLGSLAYALAVAAVIAAAVQPGPGLIRSPLSLRPLRWIGMISYGLYLWHWPIDIWLVWWRLDVGPTLLNAIRLAVTFAFATASYYLVERPIRRGWSVRPNVRWVLPAGVVLVGLTLLISTAGATKPPTYFGLGPDPVACPQPRPDETRAAKRALQASSRRVERGPKLRVLLVGDSVACSVQPGLAVVGRAAGLQVDQAAVIACGIASGKIAPGDAFTAPGSDACPGLTQAALRPALRHRPNVVLWLSTWERADIEVGGRTLRSGTPAWEREMTRRMDKVLAQLTRQGARVVIATQAPSAAARFHRLQESSQANEDESFAHLDNLLVKFAARHPGDVTVVDLAGQVCPGGPPCPSEVDGLVLRPLDGAHFSPAGAVWVSEWLLPYLESTNGRPAAGT